MFLKILRYLAVLTAVILIVNHAFAAGEKIIITAPGQTFTAGSGVTGSPNPQTCGVPFVATVYSVDSAGTNPFSSNASVTMSSNGSPATTFQNNPISLNLTEASVTASKQYVTITVNTTSTGAVGIYGNSTGLFPGSVTITAQYISSFSFATISSPTAGTPFRVTITAIDNTNAVVNSFNGSAMLYARYPSSAEDVTIGAINFTNGVYNGYVTLYNADTGNVRLQVICDVPSRTNNSNTFQVNAAALNRLVIIAPTQTLLQGTATGNGRVGGSTYGITQTAGSSFNVSVYAVDAYFNIVTGATGTITLDSSDPNDSYDASTKTITGGSAIFDVTLRTVAPGYQTLTATHSGGATAGTDIIPMTFSSTLGMFYFPQTITNKNAGQSFTTSCVAMDPYGNTITNYSGSPTLSVLTGGTPIASTNYSLSSFSFTNGIAVLGVVIYQRAFNVTLRMTSGAVNGESNPFTVNPGSLYKIFQVAPGEIYNPGYNVPADPNKGKSGAPVTVTAGTPVTINVYATDRWGNKITTNNDIVAITSGDSGATVGGNQLPQYITLTAGEGTYNIVLTKGGTQSVTATDTQTSIFAGTVNIPVLASALSYFDISIQSSMLTAGVTTTATIYARDQFGNIKTDFASSGNQIVYVSSPNTDYASPYESTMYMGGSNVGPYGYKWAITFTASNNGQRTVDFAAYRAITYTARLFVSNVYTDTPESYLGNTGTSNAFTVNFSPVNHKLQVIPPGVEERPGTIDGWNNSPTGQASNSDFSVKVNVVDPWWNKVTSYVGEVRLKSVTDEVNTRIDGLAPTPTPVAKFTTNGVATYTVRYLSKSNTFSLIASAADNAIQPGVSPYISIFSIYRFDITAVNNQPIGTQIAGVPFTISITAMADETTVATGFTGGTVELFDGNDYTAQGYTASEYLLEPRNSLTFTAGVCVMQVTMYKAATTVEGGTTGGGTTIKAKFGSLINYSNKFNLYWNNPSRVLVLAEGMVHKPALTHINMIGYYGYSGNPLTYEAGLPRDLSVLLVDDYYNMVYTAPPQTVQLQSTDAAASVPEGTVPRNVTLTNGRYQSTLTLRTVGNGTQTITADHPTYIDNTSPAIPVRHTTINHFTVEAPTGPVIAGNPFNITILARDQFGNICDDTNGGTPYNNVVDLAANVGGNNTMYPQSYPLTNGRAVASVRLFKAPLTENIRASSGSITTPSMPSTIVRSNAFERLFMITSGMTYDNGRFTAEPPTNFPMFYGMPTTRTVNDNPSHPAADYTIYSCDAYGNRTITADTIGMTITVTTNDRHAKPVPPLFIQPGDDQVIANVELHTAMQGVTVGARCSREGIMGFETPGFVTTAGDLHGFQIIVPGVYVDAGSGTATSFTDWNNGVKGTSYNQLAGTYFPVSIYAADVYGNYRAGASNVVRLRSSTADNPGSYPSPNNQITVTLVDGKASTTAVQADTGPKEFTITDRDYAIYNKVFLNPLYVNIVNSGNLEYQLIVNGVLNEVGTETTTAQAAPAQFDFTINVVDANASIKVPVGGRTWAVDLAPVTSANNSNTVIPGTLNPSSFNIVNGSYTGKMSFDRSGLFRIRATDPNGEINGSPRWSCIIDMKANTSNVNLTLAADPQNARSGTLPNIIATLRDSNGNAVSGGNVGFRIVSGQSTFGGLTQTAAVSGTDGRAIVPLTAAYVNGQTVVEASYGTMTANVTVFTSLSDPIPGEVTNYPNPFAAGTESTNIDYLLVEPTDVTLKIYNLFGDLVLEKKFSQNQPYAIPGRMNSYPWDGRNQKGDIVGNGGYICVVEAVINGKKEKMVRKIAVQK